MPALQGREEVPLPYRVVRALFGISLKAFYNTVECQGTVPPPGNCVILCPNHGNSLTDAVTVVSQTPRMVRLTAKDSLWKSPFWRILVEGVGTHTTGLAANSHCLSTAVMFLCERLHIKVHINCAAQLADSVHCSHCQNDSLHYTLMQTAKCCSFYCGHSTYIVLAHTGTVPLQRRDEHGAAADNRGAKAKLYGALEAGSCVW
jgi:hypothetical protein